MKFPKHVLLDVKRPLVAPQTDVASWQKFYYKYATQVSNPINTTVNNKSTPERIFVTRSSSYNLSWDDAKYLPFKNSLVTKPVKKVYLPKTTLLNEDDLNNLRTWVSRTLKNKEDFHKLPSKVYSGKEKNQLLIKSKLRSKVQLEKLLFLKVNKTFNKTGEGSTSPKGNRRFCYNNYTVNLKSVRPLSHTVKQRTLKPNLAYPHHTSMRSNFDINFLLREWKYSKLKYSKTAERDIVSSGSAALFAGFIGFLISEKFGIELVDSGDFYFMFMYSVFVGFGVKIFVAGLESQTDNWDFNQNYDSTKPSSYRWITVHVLFYQYFMIFARFFFKNLLINNVRRLGLNLWLPQMRQFFPLRFVSNQINMLGNFFRQKIEQLRK